MSSGSTLIMPSFTLSLLARVKNLSVLHKGKVHGLVNCCSCGVAEVQKNLHSGTTNVVETSEFSSRHDNHLTTTFSRYSKPHLQDSDPAFLPLPKGCQNGLNKNGSTREQWERPVAPRDSTRSGSSDAHLDTSRCTTPQPSSFKLQMVVPEISLHFTSPCAKLRRA